MIKSVLFRVQVALFLLITTLSFLYSSPSFRPEDKRLTTAPGGRVVSAVNYWLNSGLPVTNPASRAPNIPLSHLNTMKQMNEWWGDRGYSLHTL